MIFVISPSLHMLRVRTAAIFLVGRVVQALLGGHLRTGHVVEAAAGVHEPNNRRRAARASSE